MADDELKWIEGILSRSEGLLGHGENTEGQDMLGARCPRCNASDFVKAADLWSESAMRLQDPAEPRDAFRAGGMTDLQIFQKFPPPRRGSAAVVAVGVGVPLAALSYFLYRRFGELAGELAIAATLVITAMTLLTMLRSYSDKDYHARTKRNRLYVCRQCGQVVAS